MRDLHGNPPIFKHHDLVLDLYPSFLYCRQFRPHVFAMNLLVQTHRLPQAGMKHLSLYLACLAGLLLPLGFAPVRFPGLSILGLALLYGLIQNKTPKQAFFHGAAFGVAFFGLGISWVYVSIHEYGHLNTVFSATLTLFFVAYLAFFPAATTWLYRILSLNASRLLSCLLFSSVWCLGEYARAMLMGGFPWLLLGFSQTETPLQHLLPILGVYGASFMVCFSASCLAEGVRANSRRNQFRWMILFVAPVLAPLVLQPIDWAKTAPTPQPIGIVQANLSMRDKWDESLLQTIIQHYQEAISHFSEKNQLIVLPESAIPLPSNYVSNILEQLHEQATELGHSILLGILHPTAEHDDTYYNAMLTLGQAEGAYFKQHLVPFGEFIPHLPLWLTNWLALPTTELQPGQHNQPLIHVQKHPVASLICYELAYPQLLRQQLPDARWIVSISDAGWFGRSFAIYQQIQMAQVLSMQTARYQVVANNDGLSSLIDTKGTIVDSLPAFESGRLEATLYPAYGTSPWVIFGDTPVLLLCLFLMLGQVIRKSS